MISSSSSIVHYVVFIHVKLTVEFTSLEEPTDEPDITAPLPEQDTSDVAVVDLRTPLDHVVDPVQAAEALERTRLVLLSKVAEDEDT
jgi:hypothetical protein